VPLIKRLGRRYFYAAAGACLAELDETQVFALLRGFVCAGSNGKIRTQDIDHVMVVLTDHGAGLSCA
jgi:hypothetical protein